MTRPIRRVVKTFDAVVYIRAIAAASTLTNSVNWLTGQPRSRTTGVTKLPLRQPTTPATPSFSAIQHPKATQA